MRSLLTIAAAVLGLIVTDVAQAGSPSRRGRSLGRERIVNQSSAPATGIKGVREIVTIRVDDVDGVIPPLVRGDREFGGDLAFKGPKLTVKVHYFVQGNSIFRRIYMWAHENLSLTNQFGDQVSVAEGWSPKKRIYTAPTGKQIVAILDGLGEVQTLLDNKSSLTGIYEPGNGDLGELRAYGSHNGPDIGHYTKAVLNCDHTMRVVLSAGVSRMVKVTLPRTLTYKPPHTNGDREFNGNGPRIQIRAHVFKAGSNRVAFSLYMKAQETKGDRTTVEGTRTTTLYTAPSGFRIKRIVGRTSFPNLVDDVDTSHKKKTYVTDLGVMRVFGDRKGDDAVVYTGVTLASDRSVEVELEPVP